MSDYVTLLGAETVQHAAHSMREAADQMKRAAAEMNDVFFRHQQFLDEWLRTFEKILTDNKP